MLPNAPCIVRNPLCIVRKLPFVHVFQGHCPDGHLAHGWCPGTSPLLVVSLVGAGLEGGSALFSPWGFLRRPPGFELDGPLLSATSIVSCVKIDLQFSLGRPGLWIYGYLQTVWWIGPHNQEWWMIGQEGREEREGDPPWFHWKLWKSVQLEMVSLSAPILTSSPHCHFLPLPLFLQMTWWHSE